MKPQTPAATRNPNLQVRMQAAFSLIEMMITVALLAFMVVGLVALFVQVQRAFRGSMTQTDVLEAGRAATDLIARDMAEAAPTDLNSVTNLFVRYDAASYTSLNPAGTNPRRTNILEHFCFLTRSNLQWSCVGYVVAWPGTPLATNNLGTLYHFQTQGNPSGLKLNFQTNADNAVLSGTVSTNLLRICDGVVTLRVQCFDRWGRFISNQKSNGIFAVVPSVGQVLTAPSDVVNYDFTTNAVPAVMELELGVLEREAYEKFKALPAGSVRSNYLARSQTAGKIHVFRQRIALHNVDPAAYP